MVLHCEELPPEEEEEEEEEEGNEVPGTIDYVLLDPSEANTPYLNDLKTTGVSLATQFAAIDGTLPDAAWTVTATNSVEQATNVNGWYRFDVDVTDGQGSNAHLVFEIWDNPNFQAPEIQTYSAELI